jgi:hypothetical protein
MAVQRERISAVHRLQESLRFGEEGSIVQHSQQVWIAHEIITAD